MSGKWVEIVPPTPDEVRSMSHADLVAAMNEVMADLAAVIAVNKTLRTEITQLRGWKADALDVMADVDRVWEAAGRPGPIGALKAENVIAKINRLRALLAGDVSWALGFAEVAVEERTDPDDPARARILAIQAAVRDAIGGEPDG